MRLKKPISPTKVLIVKTSSLGDVIQGFGVVEYLHSQFPGISVDWVVDSSFHSIVAAHPLVRKAIPLSIRGFKKTWSFSSIFRELKNLRNERYDLLFDLQKNTKSGIVTALARSAVKVGFGHKTVREWLNLLATNRRFNIDPTLNTRLQFIRLAQEYFDDPSRFEGGQVRFKIEPSDSEVVARLLEARSRPRIMVCPGSTGDTRQLPVSTMIAFLQMIADRLDGSLYLVWGDQAGKDYCNQLQASLFNRSQVVDRLSVPVWQNLMSEMDVVITVDSSALHLCGTTKSPSFGLFGPTHAEIVKPIGPMHGFIQGSCPYGKTFIRQCPLLKSCPTAACMKNLVAEEIAERFLVFWRTL